MKFFGILALIGGVFTSTSATEPLPKVLLIAEGIHVATARAAAEELKGRAAVTVPAKELGDTGSALGMLAEVIGTTKWDLIQFNFGFADLRHVDPKTKSVRVMSRHAGGERVTGPREYEANLREIVTRLKATGARLIWANSTPLVGTKYNGVYESGSEVAYNAIAAKIMKEEGVVINDMHAWVLENVKNFSDSFSFRRVPIQEPMVERIEKVLGLPAKAETGEKK